MYYMCGESESEKRIERVVGATLYEQVPAGGEEGEEDNEKAKAS